MKKDHKQTFATAVATALLVIVGYQTVTLAILSAKFADMPLATAAVHSKVFGTSVELPDMAGGC